MVDCGEQKRGWAFASYLLYFPITFLGLQLSSGQASNWLLLVTGLTLILTVLLVLVTEKVLRQQLKRIARSHLVGFIFAAFLVAILLFGLLKVINERYPFVAGRQLNVPVGVGWQLLIIVDNLLWPLATIIAVFVIPALWLAQKQWSHRWSVLVPLLICLATTPIQQFGQQFLIGLLFWWGLWLAYHLSQNWLFTLVVWYGCWFLSLLLPLFEIGG
ncbi:hypothetical protein [Lapidilactobacillus salsurivasis]